MLLSLDNIYAVTVLILIPFAGLKKDNTHLANQVKVKQTFLGQIDFRLNILTLN